MGFFNTASCYECITRVHYTPGGPHETAPRIRFASNVDILPYQRLRGLCPTHPRTTHGNGVGLRKGTVLVSSIQFTSKPDHHLCRCLIRYAARTLESSGASQVDQHYCDGPRATRETPVPPSLAVSAHTNVIAFRLEHE